MAGSGDTESRLQGRRIVLGVTGGIAAYKTVMVARSLAQLGADVRVVMTAAATRFVGPPTFAGVTGNPVRTELFDDAPDAVHVELARGADLAIVAPATANSIAKMALGIADDLLSSTMLMLRCPVVVAPAMHTEMWEHPVTQQNLSVLRERGMAVVGPASGPLMSGDVGPGRMAEPDDIVDAAVAAVAGSEDLAGVRMVVTAAGTREAIDAVRFIGNRSSGLMGYEIAAEAAGRGAKVTLVSGPTSLQPPPGVELVRVVSTQEMFDAVAEAAGDADVIVKAAAVADFKPERSASYKLKKAEGPPEVRLVPTIDILKTLGHSPELRKPGSILVGFAAETEPHPDRLAELAVTKRTDKGADLLVANDVGSPDSGFDVRTNRAVLAGASGVVDVGLVTKRQLARALIDEVVALLRDRASTSD